MKRCTMALVAATLVVAFALAGSAQAVTVDWVGGTGTWFLGNSWDAGAGAVTAHCDPQRIRLAVPMPPIHEYTVRRSDRARRARLTVTETGDAVVVLPRRATLREAAMLVVQHADWLDRHITRVRLERARLADRRRLGEGRSLVIDGEPTRISEVAARFTLDALPGKQMSIDSDLSAGFIDRHAARKRRGEVSDQADFYGSMDGASKFVGMNGADIFHECLKDEGVEVLFGYPGGVVLPIFDSLYESPIKFMLTRHEQGAAHMADGYARATGKTGVVLATSGPGACNLITGLATAHMDSVPMVAITGQVRSSLIGNTCPLRWV